MSISVRDYLRGALADGGALVLLARQGLDGMTDAEYLWEPFDGCWSVRPRDQIRIPIDDVFPESDWAVEISYPDPVPSPFTTIAWRMVHLTGSMWCAAAELRGRADANGFIDQKWEQWRTVPSTADTAVTSFDAALREVQTRLEAAAEEDLHRTALPIPWGDNEGEMGLIWRRIEYFGYFEPASHLAEVRLIRDLYRHSNAGTTTLRAAGAS